MTGCRTVVIFSVLSLLGAASSHSRRTASDAGAKTPKPAPCKESATKDADLALGLQLYLEGKWIEAARTLGAWAAKPAAESDPSAGRGYYSLAYATVQLGDAAGADRWYAKAEPLLEARAAAAPSLELYYYLQALYQARGNTPKHLATVSAALQLLEAGGLCVKPDGDDLFREARLAAAAGRKDQERALFEEAGKAYAKTKLGTPAYRAFTEKGLGDAARSASDWSGAVSHYRAAVALEPLLPGIHVSLGLCLLQLGDYQGAADYWRLNWKLERQNGNALNYAIPVLDRLVKRRALYGDRELVANMTEYTNEALEQNVILEARRLTTLEEERAKAVEAGADLVPEKAAELDVADYRMLQFTTEYVKRGADLQEFALKNGLLGVLLRRGMPQPKAG